MTSRKEVDWFSKMFGLPKRTVRRRLKKQGFIVNAKGLNLGFTTKEKKKLRKYSKLFGGR